MKILLALCVTLCLPAGISMMGAGTTATNTGTQPYTQPSTTGTAGSPSTAQQYSGSPSTVPQYSGSPSTAQQYSGSPSTAQQYSGSPSTAQQYSGSPSYSPSGQAPQYSSNQYAGAQQSGYPGSTYQDYQYQYPQAPQYPQYTDYSGYYAPQPYYNPPSYYYSQPYQYQPPYAQQNFMSNPATAWMVMDSGNDMMANVYGMSRWGVPAGMLDINMEALVLGDMINPRTSGNMAPGNRAVRGRRQQNPTPNNNFGYFALLNAFQ